MADLGAATPLAVDPVEGTAVLRVADLVEVTGATVHGGRNVLDGGLWAFF